MNPRVSTPTANCGRGIVRSLLWDVALNATIPAALYLFARRVLAQAEFSSLLLAVVFPFLKSTYDLIKRRTVDPVALLVLFGLVTSMAAVVFGGDPRLLLVRESLFTRAFGLVCLVSLLFPRPIMFYFGRHFLAGSDEHRRDMLDERWYNPVVGRAHRLVTLTWGLVYVGEFVLRVSLIHSLSTASVLALAPFLTGLATIGTILWTFWYAHRVRGRLGAPTSEVASRG